jgi:pimeloyl-ACP methyl ester carboxylesterase
MAQMYDSNVIGLHTNMAPPPFNSLSVLIRQLIGAVIPSLIYTPTEIATLPSLTDLFHALLRETGYMHIQATRPDTVATGLNDSPVGLAAYIMEKFSVWTDPENRFCSDGCLTKKFTLDELLTNVMIYWTTESITSSVRFYRENLNMDSGINQIERLPVKVPTAVAAFPHEIMPHAEAIVRVYLQNVVQYSVMPRGGHFAAMEEPGLLADDIISFVQLVESGPQQ